MQQRTQAAESLNNLTIIPALQGDGSILLPFVSCHLAMLIIKKPVFSMDSAGVHAAVWSNVLIFETDN